jgi:sugar phosphate isomerase/epimerase
MRLGGPIFMSHHDPPGWAQAVRSLGYRAAYCPVDARADEPTVSAYVQAAQEAGLVIAEVGAWSNSISPDDEIRRKSVAYCQEQLALAERVGARCCVNIAGARGEQWDGPYVANLTEDTFALIVDTVRQIIDAVRPTRTYYTLETMPWVYPDSVESYLRLIQAIDRPRFAVHLDPANLVCSPQRYFANGALIRECCQKLGPHIRSCHGKDIAIAGQMTTHLSEVRPGLGGLDYATFLRELDKLEPDVPLMLEHLPNAEEYALAANYVRTVAGSVGVKLD